MRKLVPILLVLMLFLCILRTEALADSESKYVLCKPNDYVNVREHPSTKSNKAGYLECGDRITTDGVTKKDTQGRLWTHITSPSFESADAWVCSMYLQDSQIEIEKCTGYVVAKGRTAIRRAPGGKCIKWVKNGAEFSILAMSSEWALTTVGYVRRDLLDIFYD